MARNPWGFHCTGQREFRANTMCTDYLRETGVAIMELMECDMGESKSAHRGCFVRKLGSLQRQRRVRTCQEI